MAVGVSPTAAHSAAGCDAGTASLTPSKSMAEVGKPEEEDEPETVDGAEPKEHLCAANQPAARAAQHAPEGLPQDRQSAEQGEQGHDVSDGEHAVDAAAIERSDGHDPRAYHGQHQQNADAGGEPQALFPDGDRERSEEHT